LALTPDEATLLERHKIDLDSNQYTDELMSKYFDGAQRIEQLGMAVPPSFSRFLLIVNWPGMYVESIESRQDVRAQILPDQHEADPQLDQIWDANNLDADLSLFLQDRYVYGRAFFSVGANEDDPSLPLVHVESPREMSAFVDVRKRKMTSAAKFYGSYGVLGAANTVSASTNASLGGPTNATLYLPNQTVWVQRDDATGRWGEVDRDVHNLGRVPVTMSLCRRRSGSWQGKSLMQRVTGITDAAARALTNMQFASEAHGIPTRYALGVSSGDFLDGEGNPLPAWEAYYSAIWANKDPNIKVGQFTAADLKNFETQLMLYGRMAGSVTLLPTRYFGLTTTNPPSADAIRAEEAQMVKFVERQNSQVGSVLGWTSALALRFANGDWVDGSRIATEWQDPSTPTIAQREDALMKRRSVGVLSVQGYMDELGWNEQRKATELRYLAEEASNDPVINAARSLTTPGVTADVPASNA
jgi:hypothetical protein